MSLVAVDWDDTLVNVKTKAWLPGAQDALRLLRARGLTVIIHTCRASWPEGLAEIRATLAEAHLREDKHLRVTNEKPNAVAIVDDRAVPFDGNWPQAVVRVLELERRYRR